MRRGLQTLLHSMAGLAIGASVVFIGLATLLVTSFLTGNALNVPGIVAARLQEEGGLPALSFDPNFFGMGIAVLGIAAAYTIVMATRSRRMPARAT